MPQQPPDSKGNVGFVSRWSQRKLDVKSGRPVEEPMVPTRLAGQVPPVPGPEVVANGANPPSEMTQAAQPQDLPPPPTLADVQGLSHESDFKPFLARGVANDVKNAALKKLFADPHYNVMDRLDTYIDDYSLQDPIPEAMLRQMASAKFLRLFDDEPTDAAAKTLPPEVLRDDANTVAAQVMAQSAPMIAPVLATSQPQPPESETPPAMTTLICDCSQTMPLDAKALGTALHEELRLHTTLCRRDAPAFQSAILAAQKAAEPVVVACTQESRLFTELAGQTEGFKGLLEHPIKFVNIRETAGWSREGGSASPKIAAMLAIAQLPEPEPVPTVTFKSAGRLLVIGPLDEAERLASLLDDTLDVTVFSLGAGLRGGDQERRYPVLAGKMDALTGWLGAFELAWTRTNPIDLDLCTRCNACLTVCPESAIGLDYQINSELCKKHGDCSAICSVNGAIDLSRLPQSQVEQFDLVLDLRTSLPSGAPVAATFTQHAPPQGYFRLSGSQLGTMDETRTLLKLRDLVGEFEKPKFFVYKQKLCAHSRSRQVGCNACIDVCSAQAIESDAARQQIKINPNLCVGCGACTTVCPTGAISYAYPRPSEQGEKLKKLLTTYASAGGKDAALLLHSQEAGTRLINRLGRAAQLNSRRALHPKKTMPGVQGMQDVQGVPARVLPVSLWHTASIGLDVWLTAIAYGASQVWVLMTDEEAPQYRQAVRAQMDMAQSILTGLGYQGSHFSILEVRPGDDLSTIDAALRTTIAQGVNRAAGFAIQADKRATLELALDHLIEQARLTPEVIALATASPFGSLQINADRCTLCLSCVSACPSSALHDNALMPQLKFIEKNCVQCGLCVTTCPENAITLQPRLLLRAERKEARVLNEAKPYACVRCSKPFGTLKAIEAMLGKLAGHSMFQGEALERLKMCGDCRVIDIYSSGTESKITDL